MAKKILSDEDRFLRSIEKKEGGCWKWKLSLDRDGYGHFRIGSRTDETRCRVSVHRWSYQHFVGAIPNGLIIDHLCRNRACVNPAHLEPVTSEINTKRGARATSTHCKYGHPLSGENLMIQAESKRRCKKCNLESIKKWAKNHPEAMQAAQKRYREKQRRARSVSATN